jgi:hypothetical protein
VDHWGGFGDAATDGFGAAFAFSLFRVTMRGVKAESCFAEMTSIGSTADNAPDMTLAWASFSDEGAKEGLEGERAAGEVFER